MRPRTRLKFKKVFFNFGLNETVFQNYLKMKNRKTFLPNGEIFNFYISDLIWMKFSRGFDIYNSFTARAHTRLTDFIIISTLLFFGKARPAFFSTVIVEE